MDMAKKNTAASSLDEMDLIEEGVRLVSITFGVTFYTDKLFTEIPGPLLYCYAKFLELCPKENLKFYATENMKRHKMASKRVFSMLETWLKPGAPAREYIGLELKDGNIYQDAPKFKFEIFGIEKESLGYGGKNANIVSFSFPPAWGAEKPDQLLDFVRGLCEYFPFQSGHAGFSFECCRYEAERSQTYAWQKSMRHPGIDVSRIPADNKSAGQNSLKTVGWLTLLSSDVIEKLGGVEDIESRLLTGIDLIQVANGYIFKAGQYPAIGDRNRGNLLPLYKSMYRVVAPLIEKASERSPAFNIADDFSYKTKQWYKRFENA